MGNDDFKVILQAIFEKAGITKSLRDVQRIIKENPVEFQTKLDSATLKNDIKKVSSEMAKAINSIPELGLNISDKDIESVLVSLNKVESRIEETRNKLNQKIQTNIDVGNYDIQISKIEKDFAKLNISTSETENKLASLNSAYTILKQSSSTDERIKVEQRFQTELIKTKNELAKSKLAYTTSFKPITELQRVNFSTEMKKWLHDNSAAAKKFGKAIKNLIIQCETLDGASFYNLKEQFKLIKSEAAAANTLGKSATDTFKTGIQKFSEWGIASGVVMGVIQSVKDMNTNVYKLDDSILELSKVSDLSASGLKNVTEEAYKLGETVSKTGTETLDAITNLKRSGYDIGDSFTYAGEALKMANISENLKDTGGNAKSLVNIMKGFRDESPNFATHINDAINQVSNTESVDFDNLVDGSTRLSAVAKQAGMSFEQMLGTLTGAYEILGDMEKTASGQITIFTRLQAIQMEGEEEVSTVAKLQEKFSSATKGAVNIVDHTSGQLRNVYDILDDLSNVWETLDKNTQEALAFEAGGTRQKSVFLSMMSNWSGVEDAVKSATNSVGSADIENEKYLNSLSGKTERFQSAFEHLSKTILDSNMLKFFVVLGTTGVSAIDNIVQALTPLGAIGAIGGGILGAKNLGTAQNVCCRINMPRVYGFFWIQKFTYAFYEIHKRNNEASICGEVGTTVA